SRHFAIAHRAAARLSHLFVQCHSLDQGRGGTVATLDTAVHEAIEVAARVLAGKLQAAVKSRLRRHLEHRGVLSYFGAGVAAERVWVGGPEPGDDRRRVEAFGYLLRHLRQIGAEHVKGGLRISDARRGAQVVSEDASLARLSAACLVNVLEAEIGKEVA